MLIFCFLLGAYPAILTLTHAHRLQPKRDLRRALAQIDNLRLEGLMHKMSVQVQLLEETVRRLDAFSSSQTRL